MALQLAGVATPKVLEAELLHEAYIVPAAKPEQPELVLQQPSKLQDGCSISDQAGLASWMESFSGQGNALPPCEHPAS